MIWWWWLFLSLCSGGLAVLVVQVVGCSHYCHVSSMRQHGGNGDWKRNLNMFML